MKTRLILLLPFLWLLIGCSDSDSATLTLSKSKFEDVSASGETLTIDVTCNASWSVTSNKQWCIPNIQKGENDGKLVLSISANLESASRNATVTIISHKASKTIQITQKGSAHTTEEYHYQLPVIFHVLYESPSQKVSQNRLSYILNKVNTLYKGNANSADMNLTFTLATKDKNGETLSTPGVEYIEWPEDYPIDCELFMNDKSGKYVKYLWDPNSYINVMVYNFAQDPMSNSTILGISHLPFTTNSNYLEGLNQTKYPHLTLSNLTFPFCVSINALFINKESTNEIYTAEDVIVTLAHELGHYLGLHHVFSEASNGGLLDTCKDTDYCIDTPSYNKIDYDNWLRSLSSPPKLSALCRRTSCDNSSFTSYNIMDYAYSYSNRFTLNQRERIRHVLSYSPLIPGPKKGDISTRTTIDGPIDLPIRVIK